MNCQVCGARTAKGKKNCPRHLHTRESSLGLAQYIWKLESRVKPERIKEIAERFGVSTTTVYNHMKREGFCAIREWRIPK